MARLTIVVPAHDEEALIGRTLRKLVDTSSVDLIVACNGCRDRTADEARAAAPTARLLELPDPGKCAAINAAAAMATAFPLLVVDADIEISPSSLSAIADALSADQVLAAAPAAAVDLTDCDLWVRAYYRVWAAHPYLQSGVGGSGVYGFSRAGWQVVGPLPLVNGDDSYVRLAVPAEAQRRVSIDTDGKRVEAVITPPRTIGRLLRAQMRWTAGNRELQERSSRRIGARLGLATTSSVRLFARGGSPDRKTAQLPSIPDRLIFLFVRVAARVALMGQARRDGAAVWHSDRRRPQEGAAA